MTTEERLEEVERGLARTRRWGRWLVIGVALAVAAALVLSLRASGEPASPEKVRAREFVLVNENGEPRAGLAAFKDGAGLVLFDENGRPIWSAT